MHGGRFYFKAVQLIQRKDLVLIYVAKWLKLISYFWVLWYLLNLAQKCTKNPEKYKDLKDLYINSQTLLQTISIGTEGISNPQIVTTALLGETE